MERTRFLVLLTFLVSFVGYSQTIFSGTVLDENNVPLPGASVLVQGSNIGVATDFDGNFEIELPDGNPL
ncbi:carboxypeptidase-like regulatory domain-containing protein [Ulvibacterium sp.]|uniref:carboxypeptidase-like regulatory domain-containing protein n=1 Tax=Ulvibacterium sp. TaxID=2665914 RepID=UPI002616152F|nr:carboxypeptidase-like regulatory domain-containing protein [Ulvibacterium sp.]